MSLICSINATVKYTTPVGESNFNNHLFYCLREYPTPSRSNHFTHKTTQSHPKPLLGKYNHHGWLSRQSRMWQVGTFSAFLPTALSPPNRHPHRVSPMLTIYTQPITFTPCPIKIRKIRESLKPSAGTTRTTSKRLKTLWQHGELKSVSSGETSRKP